MTGTPLLGEDETGEDELAGVESGPADAILAPALGEDVPECLIGTPLLRENASEEVEDAIGGPYGEGVPGRLG